MRDLIGGGGQTVGTTVGLAVALIGSKRAGKKSCLADLAVHHAPMATVTTTYFFMTDDRATDRTQAPQWRRPQESSSSLGPWKWTAPPRG